MEKNKIIETLKILFEKGLSYNDANILLEENPKLLRYSLMEISNKLSVILNNKEPYGIIFCDNDDLYWCIKKEHGFTNLFERKDNIDYIVQMVIGYTKNKKINEYLDFDNNKTLEEKIISYRDISNDSPGYRVK